MLDIFQGWLKEFLNGLLKPAAVAATIAVSTPVSAAPLKFKNLAWYGEHKDFQEWDAIVKELVEASRLPDLLPVDVLNSFPVYKTSRAERVHFWCQLLSIMSKYESGFDPLQMYKESFKDSKGNQIISRGLLQVSIESANSYGAKLTEAEQLHDVKTNLHAGILILERWVSRDLVMASGFGDTSRGGARYWSVLRDSSKSKPKIMSYLRSLYVHDLGTSVHNEGTMPYPTYAVLLEAEKWIGTTEKGGNNRGPQVERFQKVIGRASGEPWCMSFVQFCAREAAVDNQYKLLLYPSEHCVSVFNKAKPENKITLEEMNSKGKKPDPGWCAIWQTIGQTTGHTGVVKSIDIARGKMTTIEGNTDDDDGINRDGNGVFEKVQSLKGYGNKKLLGFVRTVGV